MWDRILREPTVLAEVLRQVLFWSLSMGFVILTDTQMNATLALGSAVLALVNRALVVPARVQKSDE
jgi:hypothetical protein